MLYTKLHWKLIAIIAKINSGWMKFNIIVVSLSFVVLMSFFGISSEELHCSLGTKNRPM